MNHLLEVMLSCVVHCCQIQTCQTQNLQLKNSTGSEDSGKELDADRSISSGDLSESDEPMN